MRMICHGKRTVTELSESLSLTDNAIRAHLAALERDGLVEHVGTLPATRKPNFAYDLTPAGHQFFPKMHAALLGEFLYEIRESGGKKKLQDLMEKVGFRLIEKAFPGIRDLAPDKRISRVLNALKLSGLLAGVEERANYVVIRGCSCPMSAVVGNHPDICAVAARVLTRVLGREVQERCDRGGSPRCIFQIAASPTGNSFNRQ
jgi:predicted ArsR family transcriptional regulator